MDMVEKVARAIHEKAYETRGADRIPDWMVVAKAAIEAMREPTPEMISGFVAPEHGPYGDVEAAAIWRKMIDTALRPVP